MVQRALKQCLCENTWGLMQTGFDEAMLNDCVFLNQSHLLPVSDLTPCKHIYHEIS